MIKASNTSLFTSIIPLPLIGEGTTKVYAKDTISVDVADEIAEIMKANIRIVNKDIKLSYNKRNKEFPKRGLFFIL